MKEGKTMKLLKIENSKGHYSLDGNNWFPIDELDKDGLMKIVELVLSCDVETDEYDEDILQNKAHQIIYKSVNNKLKQLMADKEKFKDEVDRLYLDSIQKYKVEE